MAGLAPTGYLNEKHGEEMPVIVDPERATSDQADIRESGVREMERAQDTPLAEVRSQLQEQGQQESALGNVYVILQNPFYYGVFEYPKKSGNWYQGKHEPLIIKGTIREGAGAAQARQHRAPEIKEFAFTKLMTCGPCGSGITAEEKYKKLKDGTSSRYVYYGCTRHKDKDCKNGYVREEELIEQMVKIMDEVDFNRIAMREKFEAEVERLRKFQRAFVGANDAKPRKRHRPVRLR